MRFFKRNLPFTWRFTSTEKSLTLERNAPVYILSHAHNTEILNTKASLLSYAKKKGHPTVCAIRFRLERHDDIAVVRQKVRLCQEIRQNLENTYNRLNLKFLCRYQTITECSLSSGQGKEAALEYLRTKKIVTEKLEPVPLYRIGTFYLYPLKHQCVTPNHDWYFENTMIGADDILLPYEAQEEIQIILKNIDELRFWE
ncbi:MAG TPA: hypothetical protein PLY93_03695 [Turneriella sp.]|nr:hypothetical protein [Turneriella sp.]